MAALILLLLGFTSDAASAFTAAFSRRWGKSRGRWASFLLRNVLGIPVWVVGLGLAVHSPSPPWFTPSSVTAVLGWLLLLSGATVHVLAIAVLRLQAARPSVDDELAARGVYGRLRHPIYAGLLLQFWGIALVKPTQMVLLAIALGCVWVLIQARLEEVDLLQRMPAYRDYEMQVTRFLPRVGGRTQA
jgi:protein-S-isoprenylcysteine O-methyltransferase Ste14